MCLFKDLQIYIEKFMFSMVLVIVYKYKCLNFNSKFGKVVKVNVVVLEVKFLYDNQVLDWIVDYLSVKKLKVGFVVFVLFGEYLGFDLVKVVNELDKFVFNLLQGLEVIEQLIEEYIGISKDYNVFEF